MDRENEQELAKKAKEGDGEAFDSLVRIHQKHVYRFVYRLAGDMDDAVEVTQQSFVKAFFAIGRFRGHASFRTWLFRIAVNTFWNFTRDRARRGYVPLDESTVAGDEGAYSRLVEKQEWELLSKSVEKLPRRQKEALALRVCEGFSFKEIAFVMGCSTGAAKASYHHAVVKLKAAVLETET